MNGKELLLNALRGQETPRPAWLPYVGCHGGFLIGKTATEYLQSADLIVEGLLKAKELYRPDGLPVVFDLQVEAEILGCRLHWGDEVPPAVTSHPLAEGKGIADLPTLNAREGRFPLVIEALETLKERIGEDTALYGLICGPFTLALHLLGNDIFLEMYDQPEKVQEVILHCAEVGIRAADIYLDHGADVIAVVDPMTSQISADHFEEFVTPAMNRVYDHIRQRGGLSSIFVCGDVSRNLEVMVKTAADSIFVDEQIDMAHLRELCGKQGKAFGGNMKLTSVLLLGDGDDARMETLDILDKSGNKGFILAPGCDLPYAVPAGNLQAVADMVHDEYARETAKSLQAKNSDSFDDVELPAYDKAQGVILDVITLDSTSCAPCQYMMEAVEKAAEAAAVTCYVNEHKIKVREGIGMMVKLGVKNLPTICINGEVAFSSIIPDRNTLVAAIEAAGNND